MGLIHNLIHTLTCFSFPFSLFYFATKEENFGKLVLTLVLLNHLFSLENSVYPDPESTVLPLVMLNQDLYPFFKNKQITDDPDQLASDPCIFSL